MIPVLWASPNKGGLTEACAEAAERGIRSAGCDTRLIQLNTLGIGACHACGNGWGTCREKHFCCVADGYQALHEEVLKAQALVVVSAVYWGEMAEVAKSFFDRLRRCEATRRDTSALDGMPLLEVAAAGGTGNGTLSCLTQFERFAQHTGMRLMDGIPVKRYTRQYQLDAVERASAVLAEFSKAPAGSRAF